MDILQKNLLQKACLRHIGQTIIPCYGKASLEDCFQIQGGKMEFWYNVKEDRYNTTRMVYVDLQN